MNDLTWAADRHGVVDDFAGFEQQLDLLLWRILQMEVVEFDANLLHGRGLRDRSGHSQCCGGAAQYDRLAQKTAASALRLSLGAVQDFV